MKIRTAPSQKLLLVVAFIILVNMHAQTKAGKPLVSYVNPMIGTQKRGHTFPGATVPFGMVQLSPDTDTLQYIENGKYNPCAYKYCGGYQYDDNSIVGFSNTHLSGSGHSDLGDFLIMPALGIFKLNSGVASVSHSGYRSAFSHATEKASAGYYTFQLADYNIKAELTATERVGFHQYTFPQLKDAHIILDLVHGIYNYSDKPSKTQALIRRILKNQYKPSVDGLGGNDDCGQMSTWYIFSALGFYPVAPGSDQYPVGSAIINSAVLNLESGRHLKIMVQNQSEENKYVKSISVNGKKLTGTIIKHADIINGGQIIFVMTNKHPK